MKEFAKTIVGLLFVCVCMSYAGWVVKNVSMIVATHPLGGFLALVFITWLVIIPACRYVAADIEGAAR